LNEIEVSKYREKNRNILTRIHAAIENRKLKIQPPKDLYLKKVIETSKLTGDYKILSKADKDLIALALELNDKKYDVILYTNDYSMENVCSELDLKFSSMGIVGIQEKRVFEAYCPFCKIIYPSDKLGTYCERCGEEIKRRRKI
jgi:UPF0271 protein